jgi:hypothetical protein
LSSETVVSRQDSDREREIVFIPTESKRSTLKMKKFSLLRNCRRYLTHCTKFRVFTLIDKSWP